MKNGYMQPIIIFPVATKTDRKIKKKMHEVNGLTKCIK